MKKTNPRRSPLAVPYLAQILGNSCQWSTGLGDGMTRGGPTGVLGYGSHWQPSPTIHRRSPDSGDPYLYK